MEETGLEDSVTPERFANIRRIFEAAIERPANERSVFIEGACEGDRALLGEVMGMLAAEGDAGSLLDVFPASSSPDEPRFPPETVLAARYRILGLLGKGGMGEVYRAHDLILNQTVALKFLAPAHVSEAALDRFRTEVRLARQVSHPNVCRVYDLGVVQGCHFLSMEYIDGEDLSSLLTRIGRLPQDKAIEFTRKICSGLAAAHERGVLHRDLKPSNIMIDGRGQPRITDFGLAALAGQVPPGDVRSGTPAYMSPEQRAGREVTTRSDLYSLGLVLHEMFTGKPRKDNSHTPSDLVADLDPAVERVILRCVEEDPKRRPSSAFNVAMALPGADPIAAALAAGETPSPEMVAASREREGFDTRTAWLCFAAVVTAVILTTLFFPGSRLLKIAPIDIPPDGLAFRAQQMLKQFGYTDPPRTTAYGFDCCNLANLRQANLHEPARRDAVLASHQPAVVRFWYRQHRNLIFEQPGFGIDYSGLTYDSPVNNDPGMIRMSLDPTGRLIDLEAEPIFEGTDQGHGANQVDWSPIFTAAGLDAARFTPVTPRRLPPMPFDTHAAWIGTYGEGRSEPVQIEAAAWKGRPVYFSMGSRDVQTNDVGASPVGFAILSCTGVAAALVARHNLRTGRGDRRGAWRIVGVHFLCGVCSWAVVATHVPTAWELEIFLRAVGSLSVLSATSWVGYLAAEPYMRRHWPQSLISWNRLLSGRVRDPLVASHVLAGVTALTIAGPPIAALFPLLPIQAPLRVNVLGSVGRFVSFLLMIPAWTVGSIIGFVVLVVLVRLIISRHVWIADSLAAILIGLTGPLDFSNAASSIISSALVFSIPFLLLWLIRRFGLLAVLAAWMVMWLGQFPVVLGSWYAGRGVVVQLIPIAVAAWALWTIVSEDRASASEASR